MATEIKHPDPVVNSQPVKVTDDVILSILIGSGQIGGSIVQDENNKQLGKGTVTNLNLGKGSTLIGKSYKIITNVLDVNDEDIKNSVIVTHRFSNIKNNFRYTDNAPEAGVVSFEVTYNFIAG